MRRSLSRRYSFTGFVCCRFWRIGSKMTKWSFTPESLRTMLHMIDVCVLQGALVRNLYSLLVTQISTYFEMKNQLAQAGLFMLHAGNYTKAVRLLINSRDTDAIDLAIKAVGQAKNDTITHEVIDYLMGEVDGIPKVRAASQRWASFLNGFRTQNTFSSFTCRWDNTKRQPGLRSL